MGIVTVYHVTYICNRQSIRKKGLLPHRRTTGYIQYPARLFVCTKKYEALDYVSFDGVDIWCFPYEKRRLQKDLRAHTKNCYYIQERIPPNKLRLAETINYSWPNAKI